MKKKSPTSHTQLASRVILAVQKSLSPSVLETRYTSKAREGETGSSKKVLTKPRRVIMAHEPS